MNSFQQKFRKYTNEQQLFEPHDRILLSVSGGVDSSVLCHLFAQEDQYWAIAHVNFQLRGEESDQDEHFVMQLADKYKVPFYNHSFSAQTFAEEQQISTQMAARQLRRAWFEQLVTEEKFDYVALAHHHNDQLETLLLNLAKGSGIAGLRGMLPKNGIWVRPLLWATKEEIKEYAREYQLTWREDRSNAEDKYQRNWVRNHIIPALQKINPALLETTQATSQRLREVEAVFQSEVKYAESEYITKKDNKLFIQKEIILKHPQANSLLSEWLSPYGFSWNDARQIVRATRAQAQPGKRFFSSDYCLWVDREQLVVTPQSVLPDFPAWHIAEKSTETPWGQLRGKVIDRAKYQIIADKNTAALALSKLQFPLQVRRWATGDSFQPLGMQQRKKVSDFLVDRKVPRYEKERVLVLLSGDEIVWIIGHRIDNRFRLPSSDEIVYEITWMPI
ncbi:MAG: tRNA lysidine(34) synthetase TilS [Bacteroidota bacterium]